MKTTTMMKMILSSWVVCLALGALADGPTISDVVVRQRWPWSRLVDINYVLSCEPTQSVYIAVTGYNGATELPLSVVTLSGDLYNVSDGSHRIVWDPTASAYTNSGVLTQFRVALETAPTPPLYMIVDLTQAAGVDGQIAYVYESDLTNGLWGAWVRNPITNETGEAVVQSVVWTGVTTNDIYKTDKLVLRCIPAGTFGMGESANISTTLTKDFYAGVFEVTQRQWELIMGAKPSYFNNATYYKTRPVEQVSYYEIREDPSNSDDGDVTWPSNAAVNATSFVGLLRAKTGLKDFDLPTDAQWECLCRAGTTNVFNDGLAADVSNDNANTNAWLDLLGRYRFDGGYANGVTVPSTGVGLANATAAVGSYRANAWGLYDTHGNVSEWCLDWSSTTAAGGSDPAGSVSSTLRIRRGGSYYDNASSCRSATRPGSAPTSRSKYYGFRLVRTLP